MLGLESVQLEVSRDMLKWDTVGSINVSGEFGKEDMLQNTMNG